MNNSRKKIFACMIDKKNDKIYYKKSNGVRHVWNGTDLRLFIKFVSECNSCSY